MTTYPLQSEQGVENSCPCSGNDDLGCFSRVCCWDTKKQERKLFFEFMKDLTAFEIRNGLDHFRVRPGSPPSRHDGIDGISGGSARRCMQDDGTTILHLGPMLKASIRFYV